MLQLLLLSMRTYFPCDLGCVGSNGYFLHLGNGGGLFVVGIERGTKRSLQNCDTFMSYSKETMF